MTRRVLFLLCLPGLVLATVSFPEIKTVVELSSDGSARMRQELTCRFERKHRPLRLHYPFRSRHIELNSVTERSAHRSGPVEAFLTRAKDARGEFVVEWEVNAKEETRSYVVDLTFRNAVTRYRDFAHMRLPIVGRAPGPVELATVEFRLPAPADTFALSDNRDNLGTIDQGRTTGFLTLSDVALGGRWTADVVTDAAVFGDVPQHEGKMEQSERAARFGDPFSSPYVAGPPPRWFLVPVPLLIPLALFLLLYLAYGREPRVGYEARYEREPPGHIPPLAVPPIMRQRPDVLEMPAEILDAALATLLDAAREGVLDILPGDARTGEGRGFVLAHPDKLDTLDELSQNVVKYFFYNVGGGRDFVTADDIRRHALEQPDGFLYWLKQMSQEGQDWWWRKLGVGFLEPRSSRAYRFFCLAAPVLTALGWFAMPFGFTFFSFYLSLPLLILLFALTCALSFLIYAYLGRSILRWSPPAYYEHLRWQGFRRFLVEFSAIEQAPIELSAIWQEHYVYAVALGIGEKFMHGLSHLASAMSLGSELLQLRGPEWLGIGWEVPQPGLETRAALDQGINQMLDSFRSGSGVQGKRPRRLMPLMFWHVGRQ